MTKIVTIVGTRPELIRLSRVIPKLDRDFEHTLIHTGQNYDFSLNEVFFQDLEIRQPDIFLNIAKEKPMQTIATVIEKTDIELEKIKPDAVLILGDTNSSLSAIPAKRRKIPIFHMEAGNRCFDFRVPEEINRRIVDVISDINLTYSEIARQYLISEGFDKNRVINTGSPMKEVLDFYMNKINSSKILKKLKISKNKYFLVSIHREENVDNERRLSKLPDILNNLSKDFKIPVIVSTHPRAKKMIEAANLKFSKDIRFLEPFGFTDYCNLQINSKCVLSDSGTITEESSILNFPAINLRVSHERPEGMEEGAVMSVGLSLNKIINALNILKNQSKGDKRDLKIVKDYNVDNVSEKVVRIILGNIDLVNQNVWHKEI
jgi:UDP-N-acetylglucosamine 2-epimerase (non-hydrolysing)